ncbi:mucin-2 [Drosophila obscura]|uniref:mucin-2 n=1 Tax=Drosophila obscura TaxID=7282 RepID=UPI001BB19A3A|nr:mucin-2 [Drosophila obscura]
MYKTIRHGENSLQYTILPQNDDFRIEGKLSAASSSSSTASSKRSTAAGQRRRRSFFAYLGLIFVCTVIIGAVLIPFLVSAECLPNPTEWFLKTKAALTHTRAPTGSGVGIASGTGSGEAIPATLPTGSPLLQLGQSVGKTVQIVNRNGIEQFVLKVNKTVATAGTEELPPSSSTTTTTSSTTTTTTTTMAPTTSSSTTSTTTAPTTTTREQPPPPPPPPPQPSVPVSTTGYVAVLPPQGQQRHLPATTITTRIIQVPLLKSAAKKPIMPPVLAKTQGAAVQQQQAAKVEKGQNKSNSDWIKTHWAYIDPSTYFQWTGYKAEDSVLLPALLGFALIGMILIITVCLVARNKRTIVSSVRKRNRNDIEEQGAEDNATLLTTTNLSDDD